jgi:hemolysin activation/secretion protein
MENIRVSGTYTRQDSKDDSTSGLLKHKVKRSGVLSFSGDKLDKYQGGGLNTWNLGLTVGDLDLKLAADAASDASAYQTAGAYSKTTYGLSRLQKLTGNYSLYGSWKGQRAHKNLDGSEQFSLGGPENVRAYPVGEASGDNGDLFNVELRYDYPEPTDLGILQLKGFVDAGSIELHKDMLGNTNSTFTGENNYWIKGWGVGATLTKQKEYMLKAVWSKKIGDNPGRDTNGMDADGYNDASRIWAQFMIWF